LKGCAVNARVAAKGQPDPTLERYPGAAYYDLARSVDVVGFLSESGEFACREDPYFEWGGCGGHGASWLVRPSTNANSVRTNERRANWLSCSFPKATAASRSVLSTAYVLFSSFTASLRAVICVPEAPDKYNYLGNRC
jgi:hypothetical protein